MKLRVAVVLFLIGVACIAIGSRANGKTEMRGTGLHAYGRK